MASVSTIQCIFSSDLREVSSFARVKERVVLQQGQFSIWAGSAAFLEREG